MTKSEIPKRDVAQYLALPYTVIMRPDEDGDFIAQIQELPGCMSDGRDPNEALKNLRAVQQLWIEECLSAGRAVPEPEAEEEMPSGKWLQRVPRSLHKKLSELARKEGVSLNQLATSMLSEAAEASAWKGQMKALVLTAAVNHSLGDAYLSGHWGDKWSKTPHFKTPSLIPILSVGRKLISAKHERTDAYNPQETGYYWPKESEELIER